jgi:hypothetical protein
VATTTTTASFLQHGDGGDATTQHHQHGDHGDHPPFPFITTAARTPTFFHAKFLLT